MSIKFRFTLFLCCFSLAVVAGFSVFVYQHISRQLFLTAQATLTHFLQHEAVHLDFLQTELEPGSESIHGKEMYLRVFRDGKPAYDSIPAKFPSVVAPFSSTEDYLIERETREHDGHEFELIGLYDLSVNHSYLNTLGTTLAIGCGLALILAFPLSYFVTTILLDPFRQLSRQASELDAGSLSFRFREPRHSDEYSSLIRSFNALMARLESSFEQIRRFATNSSHEFRTPVTAIIAQTEMTLRRSDLPPAAAASVQKILSQALGLQRLIELLLTMADVERLKKESLVGSIPVDRLTAEVIRTIELSHLDACPKIEVISATEEQEFVGNEEMLASVLNNIIENAVKHANSIVRVSLSVTNGYLSVAVDDDGPGIPKEEREKVFEPLYRSRASGIKTKGQGLGLSLVRAYVSAAKGSIGLDMSKLGGLHVKVCLPSAPPPLEDQDA